MTRKLTLLALILAVVVSPAATALAVSPPASESSNGMVATAQRLATEVGVEILKAGGNAIDAAVAVGYAQAVVNPCCGNIGGGGFMVLHLAGGRDTVINFREKAPLAATADMFLDGAGNPIKDASLFGYKAVAVPGTVLGLDRALTRYGRLTRAQVIAPAIRLARDGFVLTRFDTDIFDPAFENFRRDPVLAKIFLRPDGTRLRPGDRLVQADLARTLTLIAESGPDAFYRGPIARAVVQASVAGGGILALPDFSGYTVTESEPLQCTYRGYVFLSVPPPSSGGTALCEILNILEGYDIKALGYHSAASTRVMVEAMRYAYQDRNTYLGDPAFVANPLDRLLSKGYAATIRARIDTKAVPRSTTGSQSREKSQTTHYSIVDKDGNAASVTYTLNGSFGALVMAPGTGVLLNDEMDDFTAKPGAPNVYGLVQGEANAIAPGKRPLSSMAPTIVTREGKPVLVLGSPGGARIITITLETALNVIDHGMTPQAAVDAPRIHYQGLPDKIFVEPFALSRDSQAVLEQQGYSFVQEVPWGAAELVQAGPLAAETSNPADLPHNLLGANDNRRPAGAAIGE